MTSNKRPFVFKKIQIKLLNAIELESLFGNNDILCLTEPQQKMKKNFSKMSNIYLTFSSNIKTEYNQTITLC